MSETTKLIAVKVPVWATGIKITLNGGVLPNISASFKELPLPSDEEIDRMIDAEVITFDDIDGQLFRGVSEGDVRRLIFEILTKIKGGTE